MTRHDVAWIIATPFYVLAFAIAWIIGAAVRSVVVTIGAIVEAADDGYVDGRHGGRRHR